MFAQDSIELLKTSGIDFDRFEHYGIDIQYFGELMMMSGLVLTNDVKWVSFHGSYDFAYLLKTLTCCELPPDEQGFMDLLHLYFPSTFDAKVYIPYIYIICMHELTRELTLNFYSTTLVYDDLCRRDARWTGCFSRCSAG